MSEEQTKNPSIHETNKAVRVLSGKPMKFTVRIHMANGSIIEYQSDNTPQLDWSNDARALWIKDGGYGGGGPVVQHEPGMVILTEENPKP